MKISHQIFGSYQNKEITLYRLENDNGVVLSIMNYGATITSIKVPEGEQQVELACGFDAFEGYFTEEYKANAPYFGATVGRYCSQIKDSKYTLDGEVVKLNSNCNLNNLHGGNVGFDKKVWTATELPDGLAMNLYSECKEEGFPGNVEASVTFRLTDDNEIKINYSAKPDKATPLSMTNHTYFNLSGFKSTVEGFKVQVLTNQLMEMDDTGCATGTILDVEGSPNDLRQPQVIGDVHAAIDGGFEHFYIFDADFKLKKVAEISDPISGRKLEVSTSEPCMLLYTGKYTSDDLSRESGEPYGMFRGFCCETHRWQNGPNIPNSPKTFTPADELFESQTIFKLTF